MSLKARLNSTAHQVKTIAEKFGGAKDKLNAKQVNLAREQGLITTEQRDVIQRALAGGPKDVQSVAARIKAFNSIVKDGGKVMTPVMDVVKPGIDAEYEAYLKEPGVTGTRTEVASEAYAALTARRDSLKQQESALNSRTAVRGGGSNLELGKVQRELAMVQRQLLITPKVNYRYVISEKRPVWGAEKLVAKAEALRNADFTSKPEAPEAPKVSIQVPANPSTMAQAFMEAFAANPDWKAPAEGRNTGITGGITGIHNEVPVQAGKSLDEQLVEAFAPIRADIRREELSAKRDALLSRETVLNRSANSGNRAAILERLAVQTELAAIQRRLLTIG